MDNETIEHAETVIARADALDKRINHKTEEVIAGLVAFQKKQHFRDKVIAALITVIMLMLTAGTLAVIKIRDNTTTNAKTCQAVNELNAKQILLWEHLLAVNPQPNETDAEKQARIDVAAFVKDTFKPIDCRQPPVLP